MTGLAILLTLFFMMFIGVVFLASSEPRCKWCGGRVSYDGYCRYFCDDCKKEDK